MKTTLRADLHVHTYASRQSGTLPFLGSRDCYSSPEDVYRVARARGMDLVCITDHDSIDGALELLARRPGAAVIVGEEISCVLPDGNVEVHIAAYEMTEALHRDVQHLRGNVFDVTGRLRQAGVFFALNHPLHFYRHQLPLDRYLRLLHEVPGVEVRNGTMLSAHNRMFETLAGSWLTPTGLPLCPIAGSDAHTLRRVGTTWTEAPGSTRAEFLASLRRGCATVGGRDGGVGAVAGDAYGVVARYVASLAGLRPCDLRAAHRAACLAFSAVSLPAQFMPLVVSAARKSAERRTVERVSAELANIDSQSPSSEPRVPSPEPRVPIPDPRSPAVELVP
jgi:predicted metal-dependent phosphoesterase TrpH